MVPPITIEPEEWGGFQLIAEGGAEVRWERMDIEAPTLQTNTIFTAEEEVKEGDAGMMFIKSMQGASMEATQP